MIERMKAEGKRSPADVVLTVDISRLAGIVSENLTQPVQSSSLSKMFQNYIETLIIIGLDLQRVQGSFTPARIEFLMEKSRLMKS